MYLPLFVNLGVYQCLCVYLPGEVGKHEGSKFVFLCVYNCVSCIYLYLHQGEEVREEAMECVFLCVYYCVVCPCLSNRERR